MNFNKLFQPGKIGSMDIRNRIIMPAMQNRGADPEGFITDRLIAYFTERAKGGVGLIIVQQSFAWPEAKLKRGISLWDDKYIPRLRDMAISVQNCGAKIAMQLGGRGTAQDKGLEPVAPSAISNSWGEEPPRELTKDEIEYYIDSYAKAAYRVKEAGFDAIEIHGGHGHLISQFLSPYTNRREDEYGGNVKKRTRFICEIIARIKEKIGSTFPVLIRMNGDDFIEGGINLEEAIKQAIIFETAGVDAIHVSGSCHEKDWIHIPSYFFSPGNLVHLAPPIKEAINIPVITVSKISDPIFAEKILEEKKADFVAMGRALIADPYLPNKAREGRLDEIRRCIYCCNCTTWENRPRLQERGISCTVNPAVLREDDFVIKFAHKPKKIMVIGGGLAGMEAARTLAERGHQVFLYECNGYLGGQWVMAAWPEFKTDYKSLIPYLDRGMKKAGVRVHLNTEVNLEFVIKEKPDAVIVATGAEPKKLEVLDDAGPEIVQANDVIIGKVTVGGKVVVVGGRCLGMEVANILASEGKHVSLVEALELGHGIQAGLKAVLRDKLVENGVYIYPFSLLMRITSTGIDVANNGSLLNLKADTVVLAVGTQPRNGLADSLKSLSLNTEIYTIGDCSRIGDAMEAINDGAEIGRII